MAKGKRRQSPFVRRPDISPAIADGLGFGGVLSAAQQALLPRTHLLFAAFGSIARPMAERAVAVGFTDLTIVDPKAYSAKSVASQCEPDEVGLLKVEAGKQRLQERGARVTAHSRDLCTLTDGTLRRNSVLVVSADNPRADILTNHLATRMAVPLLKVNVEPLYSVVAVRAVDFRRPSPVCIECQFNERHYLRQRHPKSCDGTGERSTGSPRSLSEAAGQIGLVALLEILDQSKADRWFGSEVQFCLATGRATWSKLAPNPDCLWDHGRRWPSLERLASGPEAISLAELIRCASIVLGEPKLVRFCQQVALRSRCQDCDHESRRPQWVAEIEVPDGACPCCAGPMLPVPYYVYRELPLSELSPVLEEPLAAWGVEAGAVIELCRDSARRAFVLKGAVL